MSASSSPKFNSAMPNPTMYPDTPELTELRHFLTMAPHQMTNMPDPSVQKWKMANGEEISCIRWRNQFFITGTDVVKILQFKFEQLNQVIPNLKKFEEGVFSDLRNLKPGTDAVLEEPRSEFLEYLHKHGCIRTQKKQKVFYWHKVQHDGLFHEAMERNYKRVTNVLNISQMMSSPEMRQALMMQMTHRRMASPNLMMMGLAGPGMHAMHEVGSSVGGLNGINGVHGMVHGAHLPFIQQQQQSFMGYPMMRSTLANNDHHKTGNTQSTLQMPVHHQQQQQQQHRKTISMSAIDFTPKPANNSPLIETNTDSHKASPALASPMLTDLDFDDRYFDLKDDPMVSGAGAQFGSAPATPSMYIDPPHFVPATQSPARPEVSIDNGPGEMTLDPNITGGGNILDDIWSDKYVANSPLWDDLSLMIPPEAAPNLRSNEFL